MFDVKLTVLFDSFTLIFRFGVEVVVVVVVVKLPPPQFLLVASRVVKLLNGGLAKESEGDEALELPLDDSIYIFDNDGRVTERLA